MNTHLTTDRCFIRLSREHKAFIWLQAKCATTLAMGVTENFGFKNYLVKNNIIDFTQTSPGQHHVPCFFEGHEDYFFILTVRNPYHRIFSEYAQNPNGNKKDFLKVLERKMMTPLQNMKPYFDFSERFPDYIIRVESAYEDYMKIPFIATSQYAKNKELLKLVNSIPNKRKNSLEMKNFYDQDIADLVYYGHIQYFEKFNYDKNSWKN